MNPKILSLLEDWRRDRLYEMRTLLEDLGHKGLITVQQYHLLISMTTQMTQLHYDYLKETLTHFEVTK